jgi:hypothetical protein
MHLAERAAATKTIAASARATAGDASVRPSRPATIAMLAPVFCSPPPTP